MMDTQFNPFIRENNPPILINNKTKKHKYRNVWVPILLPALKRAWTEVHVEAIDVFQFRDTTKSNDNGRRLATPYIDICRLSWTRDLDEKTIYIL